MALRRSGALVVPSLCLLPFYCQISQFATDIGETSKLIGCSLHIQQPAAANLYRKCYTLLLDAAAFWQQPAVMNFDVFPNYQDISQKGKISVKIA